MININISAKCDNQKINYHLLGNNKEPITNISWNDLYRDSQRRGIPYYWISIAIIKEDQNVYKTIGFDGTNLHTHFEGGQRHYLENVVTIHHIFLHCFDLNNGLPLEEPTVSPFSFELLPNKVVKFAMNSMKIGMSQTDISKIQYIVGSQLLKHNRKKIQEEGHHWLNCASKNGEVQAKEYIKMLKD